MPIEPSSISGSSNHTLSPLLALHKALLEIPSTTGTEHDVGSFLRHHLESLSFTVENQTLPPLPTYPDAEARQNIFAYRGSRSKPRVLLTSHIDTVPPYISYSSNSTHILGRGSNDAKGCVAAQITALLDLLASNDVAADDVALLFVVGEEVNGDGMKAANTLRSEEWDAVIFGEPTELKLVEGHKGIVSFSVKAKGKAAHSGYPWMGVSAFELLLPALVAIRELNIPGSEKYGESTINIGTVEVGVAANVVPAQGNATVAIRLASEDPVQVTKDIVMDTIREVDKDLEVEFLGEAYGPVACDTDVVGFETMVVNYGTDVPRLEGNHKRYLYGPGSILTAHSDDEFVLVKDLEEAVEGYKKLMLGALKKSR